MSQRGGKQRKHDDSDDGGTSMAGKVVLGVAAAAAGAAIGYLGSRLLSSWLSEPEEEKQMKSKASKSDNDYKYDGSKPPSKGHGSSAHYTAASHVNTDKHDATVELSLHEQLLKYYQEYVVIPSDDIDAAQKVVDEVTLAVRSRIRDPNSFKGIDMKIGDLVPFGSATEDLQVIHPNSFDVMIPIMFGSQCRAQETVVGGRKVPGRFVIVAAEGGMVSKCGERNVFDGDQQLIRRKLIGVLQAVVAEAAETVSGYHCVVQPASHNPTAISVAVCTDGCDEVTVNFVPFIIIDSHLFLPAACPIWCSEQSENDAGLWMESFARQEKWSVDRFEPSTCGHLIVLRILKAVRLNHAQQFGTMSSYHLKLLLFHVLEDLPDSCDWDKNAVGERLIDVLTKLTEMLYEHHMPHYFEQNVNTLEDVPPEMCLNLAKFLEKKLAHNDITSLLKRDY